MADTPLSVPKSPTNHGPHPGHQPLCRERQSSHSEDLASDINIQATNDDAAVCKCYAVQMGYWKDDFIGYLTRVSDLDKKPPEISRGYFARVAGIRLFVDKALSLAGPNAQIINMGAGYDTLFWNLCRSNAQFSTFVEIDFPEITTKKLHAIRRENSPLIEALGANLDQIEECHHIDLHCPKYHIIGVDLRSIKEVSEKLQGCGLDLNAPTIIVSECVLVYMSDDHSSNLLTFLASKFPTSCYINYEQVNVDDKFGVVMQDNFRIRGLPLAGIEPCKNLDTQKARFAEAGYHEATGYDMNEVYRALPQTEVQRVERIEMLDETELLTQLLHHYCITIAWRDEKGVGFKSLGL